MFLYGTEPIKVCGEDYLCQTHLWSLLKTKSALIKIARDGFWEYAFFFFFNKLYKMIVIHNKVLDTEMEHWVFED